MVEGDAHLCHGGWRRDTVPSEMVNDDDGRTPPPHRDFAGCDLPRSVSAATIGAGAPLHVEFDDLVPRYVPGLRRQSPAAALGIYVALEALPSVAASDACVSRCPRCDTCIRTAKEATDSYDRIENVEFTSASTFGIPFRIPVARHVPRIPFSLILTSTHWQTPKPTYCRPQGTTIAISRVSNAHIQRASRPRICTVTVPPITTKNTYEDSPVAHVGGH